MKDATESITWQTVALCMLTSALWGGTPVAISYTVETLPPVATAGIRFALGALFMIFWCRVEGTELRLRAGQLRPTLAAGAFLFVQVSLFTVGVAWSNSSHGSMLINTFVFWVAAIEHFVTRTSRLSSRKLTGLILASAGVFFLLSHQARPSTSGDQASLAGDALLLISAALLSVKVIYIKRCLKTVEAGKLIFWHDVFGVLMFAGYSACFELVDWNAIDRAAI